MKTCCIILIPLMLMVHLSFCIPGPPPGIQFLLNKSDTIGIVIGIDTFGMLSIDRVKNANATKISFDYFQHENDSLKSIIQTLQKINRKNDHIIIFQESENKLLQQDQERANEIIDEWKNKFADERKKAIPWKISTGVLIVITIIKYL